MKIEVNREKSLNRTVPFKVLSLFGTVPFKVLSLFGTVEFKVLSLNVTVMFKDFLSMVWPKKMLTPRTWLPYFRTLSLN